MPAILNVMVLIQTKWPATSAGHGRLEEKSWSILFRLRLLLCAREFIRQRSCAVNLPKRLLNTSRIDGHCAPLHVAEGEIPGKRLDVAVENDPDHFALLVHGGRAGVAADDVSRGNEVERSLEIQLCLRLHPAFWQVIGRFVTVLSRVFIGPAQIGLERNRLSILLIALYGAIAQPKRKGGVRRLSEATLSETCFGDDSAVAPHHGINFVFELLTCSSGGRIDRPHRHNQRIVACVDRGLPAF